MSTTSDSVQPHIGKDRLVPVPTNGSKKARVNLLEDAQFAARLDVFYDGTTWRYGVDDKRRATFLEARQNGDRVDVPEPDWMWSIFNGLDLERQQS